MTAVADVDLHQVPGHVAVVGGGVDEASLADVVDGALSIGLRWLTIEALPAEGWGDPLEVSQRAFADVERLVLACRDDFHRRGVCASAGSVAARRTGAAAPGGASSPRPRR